MMWHWRLAHQEGFAPFLLWGATGVARGNHLTFREKCALRAVGGFLSFILGLRCYTILILDKVVRAEALLRALSTAEGSSLSPRTLWNAKRRGTIGGKR